MDSDSNQIQPLVECLVLLIQWCHLEWVHPRTPWCNTHRRHPCISPQKWRAGLQETWLGTAPFPSSSLPTREILQHIVWCTWMEAVVTWDRWTWTPCPCRACPWVLIRNTADIPILRPLKKSVYKCYCHRITGSQRIIVQASICEVRTSFDLHQGYSKLHHFAGLKTEAQYLLFWCFLYFCISCVQNSFFDTLLSRNLILQKWNECQYLVLLYHFLLPC